MKYVGLDLHKRNIFATVLGADGKIYIKGKYKFKKRRYQLLS
jgi:hypothetical protein